LPLLGQSLPTLPPSVLAWDSDNKEYNAKPGELSAVLTYYLTNVSSSDVLINYVRTSCGCTVPKLPCQPWKLAPGESGELPFTIDLRGKSGNLTKVATLETSQGFKSIVLRVNIPALPSSATAMGDRLRNIQIAVADRQAVFKGDCAKCHVEPGLGKTGEALFKGVCGVCHLAERRASMVPDLHALKVPTGPEYWKTWITAGKPGSLMPAFAKSEGGPLTDEQITSLVDHLTATITKAPSPTTTAAPVPPPSSGPGGH
jgi:mono/diheme cytochrome c family protein